MDQVEALAREKARHRHRVLDRGGQRPKDDVPDPVVLAPRKPWPEGDQRDIGMTAQARRQLDRVALATAEQVDAIGLVGRQHDGELHPVAAVRVVRGGGASTVRKAGVVRAVSAWPAAHQNRKVTEKLPFTSLVSMMGARRSPPTQATSGMAATNGSSRSRSQERKP